MAVRLTGFSRLLITLFIVGLLGVVLYYFANESPTGKKLVRQYGKGSSKQKNANAPASKGQKTFDVAVVNGDAFMAGVYFNKGLKHNPKSRFFTEYGLKVNFSQMDKTDALNAWRTGKVDFVCSSLDFLPTKIAKIRSLDPQIILKTAYSKGSEVLIVKKDIKKFSNLKGKKIAVTPATPSHTLLLQLLKKENIKLKDVKIVKTREASEAAFFFKIGQVDAAIVKIPEDRQSLEKVEESHILATSADVPHTLSEVLIAQRGFVEINHETVENFVEGWLRAVVYINSSDTNKRLAANALSKALNVSGSFSNKIINSTEPATYEDNLHFFDIRRTGIKTPTGKGLYQNIVEDYLPLKLVPSDPPTWLNVSNPDIIGSLNKNVFTKD